MPLPPLPQRRHHRRHLIDHISEARHPFDPSWTIHSLGNMDVPCPDCSALHWMAERLTNSSDTNPHFGMCCFQGKIKLGRLHNIPQELENPF